MITETGSKPHLSILIPSYNFPAGVLRIVLPLLAEGRSDIEILVHDDSSDDSVEGCMQELSETHPCLSYVRNSPSLGAVNNWNSLLHAAHGTYLILIHHDDFPLTENFATELLTELENNAWPDAILLSCLAYDAACRKIRLCICNPIRSFMVRHWPSYLFTQNVVGPPSVLVVRRELFEGYDPKLKWLVDVEAYYRFLKQQPLSLVLSRIMMVSSTGLSTSITTSIMSNVREITNTELAYIDHKLEKINCRPLLRRATSLGKFRLALERISWVMIKTIGLVRNIMVAKPLPAVLRREHCFPHLYSTQEKASDAD